MTHAAQEAASAPHAATSHTSASQATTGLAPLLPRGFATATASASIKKPGRDDMALVRCAPGTALAAMYTTNRVCAAPVQLSRRALHESGGRCGALIINSGCANAATGAQGMRDAEAIAAAVAGACGIPVQQVQANSTGVIGVTLPVERMVACIPQIKEQVFATEDFKEGIRSFVERRQAKFVGR